MRKFTLLAIFMFVSSVFAIHAENAPVITIEPESIDLGNLYVYGEGKNSFVIKGKNVEGNVIVGLPSLGTSYQCVNASWQSTFYVSTDEVNSESGATVNFTLYPFEVGSYSANVRVVIEDTDYEVTMPLSWNVAMPPAMVVSSNKVKFGEIAINETKSQTITVEGTNLKGDITIKQQEGSQLVIDKASLTDDNGDGAISESFTISLTPTIESTGSEKVTLSSPDATDVSITVSWTAVKPSFSVDSEELCFGDVIIGEPVSKTLTIIGKALTGDVTISEPQSGAITLGSSSISAIDASNYSLQVTLNARDAEITSDSFVLSTEGYAPITVNVTWNPVKGDDNVVLGSANATSSQTPFASWSTCYKVETIFPKAEMESTGLDVIKGLAFAHATSSTSSLHVTMWMENTEDESVSDSEFSADENLTKVYEGDIELEKGGSFANSSIDEMKWFKIPVSEGFDYTGKNLKIKILATGTDWLNSNFAIDNTKSQKYLLMSSDNDTFVDWGLPAVPSTNNTFLVTKFFGQTKVANNPILQLSETEWVLGNITTDETATKSVTIIGSDLVDEITVTSNNSDVTIDKETISAEDAKEGAVVNITVAPSNTESKQATVTFSSTNAEDVVLTINWEATSGIDGIAFSTPSVVSVYDMQGRFVKNASVCGSFLKNELNNLNQGIYLVKLNNKVFKVWVK